MRILESNNNNNKEAKVEMFPLYRDLEEFS